MLKCRPFAQSHENPSLTDRHACLRKILFVPSLPAADAFSRFDALCGFDMFWIAGGGPVFVALVGLLLYPFPDYWREPITGFIQTQMKHVPWEGFSAWDLIMPLFLFIVGTAMPFSIGRRIEAGQSKAAIYRKVFIRVAILWILGMVSQGNLLTADPALFRFFSNTLQAIAVGYLAASVALLHLRA